MKIILPISWRDGWREVNAEIVDVAPHLAHIATFVVHCDDFRVVRLVDFKLLPYWRISNIETGDGLPQCGRFERADAISSAREFLLTITPQGIEQAFRRADRRRER